MEIRSKFLEELKRFDRSALAIIYSKLPDILSLYTKEVSHYTPQENVWEKTLINLSFNELCLESFFRLLLISSSDKIVKLSKKNMNSIFKHYIGREKNERVDFVSFDRENNEIVIELIMKYISEYPLECEYIINNYNSHLKTGYFISQLIEQLLIYGNLSVLDSLSNYENGLFTVEENEPFFLEGDKPIIFEDIKEPNLATMNEKVYERELRVYKDKLQQQEKLREALRNLLEKQSIERKQITERLAPVINTIGIFTSCIEERIYLSYLPHQYIFKSLNYIPISKYTRKMFIQLLKRFPKPICSNTFKYYQILNGTNKNYDYLNEGSRMFQSCVPTTELFPYFIPFIKIFCKITPPVKNIGSILEFINDYIDISNEEEETKADFKEIILDLSEVILFLYNRLSFPL